MPEPPMSELPWAALVQPDSLSCGPSSLVVARMLADPSYAASLGVAPTGSAALLDSAGVAARFRDEVLAMHRRVTSSAAPDGRAQLPWPRRLGTPPWAVARQLAATPGPDGTSVPYGWHLVRTDPATGFARLSRSPRVTALFLGNDWLPRHIVLVIDTTPERALRVYDPARGRVVLVEREDFTRRRLGVAGWDAPWFVVTPQ